MSETLWNGINDWLATNVAARMGPGAESTYAVRTVTVADRPWDQESKDPTEQRILLPYALVQSAEVQPELGDYACRGGDEVLAGYQYTYPYLMALYVVERNYGTARAACRTLVRRGINLVRYARHNGLVSLADSGNTERVDNVLLRRAFAEDRGWQTLSAADSAAYFYIGYVQFDVITEDI